LARKKTKGKKKGLVVDALEKIRKAVFWAGRRKRKKVVRSEKKKRKEKEAKEWLEIQPREGGEVSSKSCAKKRSKPLIGEDRPKKGTRPSGGEQAKE